MSTGYIIRDQYAIHYLTFTTVGWVDVFTRLQCKEIIIDSLKYCQIHKGLVIYAYVIMPSHLHVIFKCSKSGPGLSSIVRDFKKFTSKAILKFLLSSKNESRRHWLKVVFEYHTKYNSKNKQNQL